MSGDHNITFMPERLNNEPVVFGGLTNTEMFQLGKLGLLVWFPLCLLVAWLCGRTILGLGGGLVMTLLTVAAGAKWLQRVKRGRPDGYYQRSMQIHWQDRGLSTEAFIRYSGRWDVRRASKPLKRSK